MIEISINDTGVQLSSPYPLSKALAATGYTLQGAAVAVNEEVVPREDWDHHTVSNGDRVLVFNVVAGG